MAHVNLDMTSAESVSSGIKIRMILRSMRLEDVSLAGACSLNDGKVIWAHGMEKTINGVKLCGIHLVYTPNQRGGGDDAGF